MKNFGFFAFFPSLMLHRNIFILLKMLFTGNCRHPSGNQRRLSLREFSLGKRCERDSNHCCSKPLPCALSCCRRQLRHTDQHVQWQKGMFLVNRSFCLWDNQFFIREMNFTYFVSRLKVLCLQVICVVAKEHQHKIYDALRRDWRGGKCFSFTQHRTVLPALSFLDKEGIDYVVVSVSFYPKHFLCSISLLLRFVLPYKYYTFMIFDYLYTV